MSEVLATKESADGAAEPVRAPRAFGIDAMRIVMAFAVVTLHAYLGGVDAPLISIACRCAVPFFLITSGYFLKVPERLSPEIVTRPLLRLLPIYVFWMAIFYAFAYALDFPLRFGVRDLLSGGTAFHLWYLPAVGVALAAVPCSLIVFGVGITGFLCGALALLTIVFGGYHDVLGLAGESKRGGLLVAPAFVFLGYMLRRAQVASSRLVSLALALFGFLIIVVEETWIDNPAGEPYFTFGSFLYGAGVFLLARSLKPSDGARRLATAGRYALGVYITHMLFVWMGDKWLEPITTGTMLWVVPLYFGAALLLTIALSRIAYLRRFVL